MKLYIFWKEEWQELPDVRGLEVKYLKVQCLVWAENFLDAIQKVEAKNIKWDLWNDVTSFDDSGILYVQY